jgi:uncharacterized protein (TIGR03083 family)
MNYSIRGSREFAAVSKSEIRKALEDSRKKLLDAIDGLSEEEMQMPTLADDWSVKDVLVHLTMWEAELVKLLWQTSQGMKPNTAHFFRESIDEINAMWFESNLARSLDRVMEDFHGVRRQTLRRLENFTDDEINDSARYRWLIGLSLGEKIARSTYKHETEHEQQIRSWRQEMGI